MSAREPRDTTRPLPLGLGAARVFALTFEGLVWTRRGLFVAALMVLPVLLAAAFRWLRPETMPATWGSLDIYRWIVTNYYLSNALPLAALFYAGSLVTDELEGRTIVYLLTRPVSRASILAGRFAAYLAAGLALSAPVLLVTFLILGGAAPGLSSVVTLARDLGVAALTLFVYGAFFMLLGIVFRRPLIAGLFFLYGWELLVYVGGHMPRVTLTAYLRSLVSPAPSTAEGAARLLSFTPLPVGESLLSLLLASAVFFTLAFVLFASRELLPEG